jgi:hypothetical protein
VTRIAAAFALAAALALPSFARAQSQAPKRGPSTATERKRVLEITHRLEQQPFGKGADSDRVWLMQWIDEVPDVNIRYCPGPLYGLVEAGHDGRALWVQSLFGMAAFAIERPKDAEDWVKAQVAGLQSALAAYQAAVKADPKARHPALDRLVAARKAGTLAQIVREEMVACDPDFQPAGPDAI